MIIKLDKLDIEMCKKTVAEHDYTCTFFTMENNPNTVQVEIRWDGRELTPTLAYHFGRMLQMAVEERMQDKISAMIKQAS